MPDEYTRAWSADTPVAHFERLRERRLCQFSRVLLLAEAVRDAEAKERNLVPCTLRVQQMLARTLQRRQTRRERLRRLESKRGRHCTFNAGRDNTSKAGKTMRHERKKTRGRREHGRRGQPLYTRTAPTFVLIWKYRLPARSAGAGRRRSGSVRHDTS